MFRPNTYREIWTPGSPDVLAGKGRGLCTLGLPYDSRSKIRPACAMALACLDREVASKEVQGGAEFELPEKVFGFTSRAAWISDAVRTRLVLTLDRCPTFPHPGLAIDLALPPDAMLYYQPALTPQEIEMGAERLEDVVGSYAVYGRFGKIAHIFAGWWTDAKGERCKAELLWDGRQLTLVLPQKWMQADSRAWPVIKNATLGYTTNGGSNVHAADTHAWACGPWAATENGTTDSLYFWGWGYGASAAAALGVWQDNGSTYPGTRIVDTAEFTLEANDNAPKAYTENTDSPAGLVSGTSYWFGIHTAGNAKIYYDVVTKNSWYRPSDYSAGAVPDPYGAGGEEWTGQMTAYVNYTPVPSGPSIPVIVDSLRRRRNN